MSSWCTRLCSRDHFPSKCSAIYSPITLDCGSRWKKKVMHNSAGHKPNILFPLQLEAITHSPNFQQRRLRRRSPPTAYWDWSGFVWSCHWSETAGNLTRKFFHECGTFFLTVQYFSEHLQIICLLERAHGHMPPREQGNHGLSNHQTGLKNCEN
jgi:hypothetical protein